MTIIAVLLMSLGMPLQEPTPESGSVASDSTRIAIAKAALEHAVVVAQEDMGVPIERMFLSVSGPGERRDLSDWAGNDTVAYLAIAEEHGMEIQNLARHPAYHACRQSRRSEACRALRGATSLSVLRAGVSDAGDAFAWIKIRTIPATDGRGYSLYFQELKLEKAGDAWKVVSVLQAIDG